MIGRRGNHQDRALIWEIASALLRYPNDELVAALPEIAAAARESGFAGAEEVAQLAERWQQADLNELQAEYVEVFDLGRARSLYLTWHQYGDRRQRGMVLLKLKHTYQDAGFAPVTDELPDWLPMTLEFAAQVPHPIGRDLLEKWRAPIELIRRNLGDRGDEHVVILDAVSSTLSKLGSDMQAAVEKLLQDGPPDEEVGLAPYGPDSMLSDLPPSEFAEAPQPIATGGSIR